MFGNTLTGRRVLVTGHTGFAGSWLCLWLHSLGAIPIGLSLPDTTKDHAADMPLRTCANVAGLLAQDMRVDMNEAEAVVAAMRAAAPDYVFHLALPEQGDAAAVMRGGMLGTLHVLEAAAAASVRAVVCVAGDRAYAGPGYPHPCREDGPCARSAYGAACACATHVVQTWAALHAADGPRLACVRTGRLLGGGEWRQGSLLGEAARAWTAERPCMPAGQAAHPWQHVLEALSGCLWLCAGLGGETEGLRPEMLHGAVLNCGPAAGMPLSARDMLAGLRRHWSGLVCGGDACGGTPGEQGGGTMAPGRAAESGWRDGEEAGPLALDSGKAWALLGWRSVLDAEEMLRLAADWYKAWRWGGTGKNPQDMRSFSLGQIAAYEACAASRDALWTR